MKVSREDAGAVMTYDVPAARSVAWSYWTEPGLRATWQPGVKRIDESTSDGRRGAGTRNHCVHGKDVVLEEVLDWRPFDYYTVELRPPMPYLKPVRITFELEDTPEGTRVTELMAPSPGFGQRLAFAMLARMIKGKTPQAQESLRSALSAAAGTSTADARPDGG